jgi:hypothetical protein
MTLYLKCSITPTERTLVDHALIEVNKVTKNIRTTMALKLGWKVWSGVIGTPDGKVCQLG